MITLRETRAEDVAFFFEQQVDPVAVHMAAFTAKDPADSLAFKSHWARLLGDDGILKRTVLVDGDVAGSIVSFDEAGHREICYWLGREYWGQGIATFALGMFLEEELTRPLQARAAADNHGSIRVLEKCDFKLLARERGYANARQAEIEEVVMVLR